MAAEKEWSSSLPTSSMPSIPNAATSGSLSSSSGGLTAATSGGALRRRLSDDDQEVLIPSDVFIKNGSSSTALTTSTAAVTQTLPPHHLGRVLTSGRLSSSSSAGAPLHQEVPDIHVSIETQYSTDLSSSTSTSTSSGLTTTSRSADGAPPPTSDVDHISIDVLEDVPEAAPLQPSPTSFPAYSYRPRRRPVIYWTAVQSCLKRGAWRLLGCIFPISLTKQLLILPFLQLIIGVIVVYGLRRRDFESSTTTGAASPSSQPKSHFSRMANSFYFCTLMMTTVARGGFIPKAQTATMFRFVLVSILFTNPLLSSFFSACCDKIISGVGRGRKGWKIRCLRLGVGLSIIAIVILVGTAIFYIAEKENGLIESFHLAVMAAATVGAEDDKIVSSASRLWA